MDPFHYWSSGVPWVTTALLPGQAKTWFIQSSSRFWYIIHFLCINWPDRGIRYHNSTGSDDERMMDGRGKVKSGTDQIKQVKTWKVYLHTDLTCPILTSITTTKPAWLLIHRSQLFPFIYKPVRQQFTLKKQLLPIQINLQWLLKLLKNQDEARVQVQWWTEQFNLFYISNTEREIKG